MKRKLKDKNISEDYVKMEDQLADIFIKSLGRLKFVEMQERD
ncbi:unnamed protein product [Spirodela intermedia]|uniref:Uncharacterized protein n=1 Tax=Spirodela intermedia TaxID=51605 RepID=A0A7I8J867_SPIIN|nr:unnamed protein product [Spirodela intermedia]CAA6666418.1 unnamed protein product [Spirodela intermedia]